MTDMPSNNTWDEAFPKVLKQVQALKMVDGAEGHAPFIVQLETAMLSYLKQPQQRAAMDGQMPAAPPSAPSFQGTPGGGMGGVAMGAAPNTDELRRLLSAGG